MVPSLPGTCSSCRRIARTAASYRARNPTALEGAAGELGAFRHDHFVQRRVVLVAGALEMALFGDGEAADVEEVDDVLDVAGEVARVARTEHRLGSSGDRDACTAALDAGQEHAVQVAETSRVDGPADEWTFLVDDHRDRVAVGRGGDVLGRGTPRAEQPRRRQHQHQHSDGGDRKTDRGHLEHPERLTTLLDEEVGHDEVRRRADHRHDAAEHRRERQRHEQQRRRVAGAPAPRDDTRRERERRAACSG